MIPDVFYPVNVWVDLYELSGIEKGKSLKITNKRSFLTMAWEGDAPPPQVLDNINGEPVPMWGSVRNTDLSVGFWIMSRPYISDPSQMGRLSVQEWLE